MKKRIKIIIEKEVKPYGIVLADDETQESVFIPVIMFSELQKAISKFKRGNYEK